VRNEAALIVLEGAKATAEAGVEGASAIAPDANSALGKSSIVMIVGLVVALVVGIVLALTISRSITRPLSRAIEGLTSGSEQVAALRVRFHNPAKQLAEGATEQASSLESPHRHSRNWPDRPGATPKAPGRANELMKEAQEDRRPDRRGMHRWSRRLGGIKDSSGEDFRHHQDHRGNRLPDQPARRAERGWKRLAPANTARASRSWPRRCATRQAVGGCRKDTAS
jgi:hypothetical protein